MRDRPHSEAVSEQLRADPAYAAELLAEIRRDGTPAELAILLRQLTRAFEAHLGSRSLVERSDLSLRLCAPITYNPPNFKKLL